MPSQDTSHDVSSDTHKGMVYRFDSVGLNSGDRIEFSPGVTVIVGPNNVGKSQLLSNLGRWEGGSRPPMFPVSKDIKVVQPPDADEVISWCNRNLLNPMRTRKDPSEGNQYSGSNNMHISEQNIRAIYANLSVLSPRYFSIYLRADDRAQLTEPKPSYNVVEETPRYALQHIWRRDEYRETLYEVVASVFGVDISVNLEPGSQITLHLGQPTTSRHESRERYLDEITALPQIHGQGHGLRSFVGMMMEIIAGNHLVLLIDEPEAFLHPPQARLFGTVLERVRRPGSQIILSTHSADVLQGLVAAQEQDSDFRIIRLTRDPSANTNHAAQISSETIKAITRDPLMRHSDILDGLFFHGTVLCESDGDATFYSAVYSHLIANDIPSQNRLDLMFTHTNGGYSRFPAAVAALRSAKVATAVVLDIDVLGNESQLIAIVEAMGSSLELLALEPFLKTVRAHVASREADPLRAEFRKVAEPIITRKDRNLSGQEVGDIRTATKKQGGWDEVKRFGKRYFRNNDYIAISQILSRLAQIGVFVVPEGELESFNPAYPSVPKSAWLQAALEDGFDSKPGPHRDFVNAIYDFIAMGSV